MKKGYLSLTVATSIMLVAMLVSAVNKAASEGISVYIVSLAALMIIFLSTKIYKKKKIDLPGKKIAVMTLILLIAAYISAIFAPHVVALLVISVSLGINIQYLRYSLKMAINGNEGF